MDIYVNTYLGVRNDVGKKNISKDFLANVINGTYDDLVGVNKILFPEEVNATEYSSGNGIDGEYEYRFLNADNILQTKNIVVTGGLVYERDAGTAISTDVFLTAGRLCKFTVLNDKLFITNGFNYPVVYDGLLSVLYQMGSCAAVATANAGKPSGTYYYSVSYVINGVDTILGSRSNTVAVVNKQVTLAIPLGPTGTTARKIYRTKNDGVVVKLLTTIGNNTATTYTDNTADVDLGANIETTNNELPKPYLIETNSEKLVGTVVDKYPTQMFVPETDIEWFDAATYTDISNFGNDNTPILDMAQDFNQIVVMTRKQTYLVDVSSTSVSVTITRANVGALAKYTAVNIPKNLNFEGGVGFIGNDKKFRVLNGQSGDVLNTLDDVKSDNLSQSFQTTLDSELSETSDLYAVYFNDKYMLLQRRTPLIFTFNTKNMGWATENYITTDETNINMNYLAISANELYLGKSDASLVEKMYADVQYRGEEYTMTIQSGALPTIPVKDAGATSYTITDEYKYFRDLRIDYITSLSNNLQYKLTIDGDTINTITGELDLTGGTYSGEYYSSLYYDVDTTPEDYKIIRINRYGESIEYELKSTEGVIKYRGSRLKYDPIANKEG